MRISSYLFVVGCFLTVCNLSSCKTSVSISNENSTEVSNKERDKVESKKTTAPSTTTTTAPLPVE